jgi:hypothetical protein
MGALNLRQAGAQRRAWRQTPLTGLEPGSPGGQFFERGRGRPARARLIHQVVEGAAEGVEHHHRAAAVTRQPATSKGKSARVPRQHRRQRIGFGRAQPQSRCHTPDSSSRNDKPVHHPAAAHPGRSLAIISFPTRSLVRSFGPLLSLYRRLQTRWSPLRYPAHGCESATTSQ